MRKLPRVRADSKAHEPMKNLLHSRDGLFHLPAVVALIIISSAGFGVWGIQRQWKENVTLQLALDACIGAAATEFRDHLNSLSASNERIRSIRAALMAAAILPEAIPPLRVALASQVAYQQARIAKWTVRRASMLSPSVCGGAHYAYFPALPVTRTPPDLVGPTPLHWSPIAPSGFHLQAGKSPRHSAAVIKGETHENTAIQSDPGEFKAEWASPEVSKIAKWSGFR
jgi:hypothetical protein